MVRKPGLVFEPSLVGGDVILQQGTSPCLVIELGLNESVRFNNIKMLLRGPNMDVEVQGFQADMNFETEGNEKCIKEFFAMQFNKEEQASSMYCQIMLRSGVCRLYGCVMSLE